MFLVLRKTHLEFFAFVLAAVLAVMALFWTGRGSVAAFSAAEGGPPAEMVVVDPGHGGEDGGAVAKSGEIESGLNLEVAGRVNLLLRFLGQNTVMTRTEDVSIYSPGSETLRQKKASDLKNRVALVNGFPDAVLISIHQNSLPSSPRTQGAQVFYNGVDPAKEIAAAVQARLNGGVNAGNEKGPKKIADTIYLTKHVLAPAILVECGFLSNGGEAAKLQDPAHQLRLAAAVAAGYYSSV